MTFFYAANNQKTKTTHLCALTFILHYVEVANKSHTMYRHLMLHGFEDTEF